MLASRFGVYFCPGGCFLLYNSNKKITNILKAYVKDESNNTKNLADKLNETDKHLGLIVDWKLSHEHHLQSVFSRVKRVSNESFHGSVESLRYGAAIAITG